jgi:hypothetical protein
MTRGGRRVPHQGVTRPDPDAGPWAELACQLHDELYTPANRPIVAVIAHGARISTGHVYKILTGAGRSRWNPMGVALVGFFGGDLREWEHRWATAEERQQRIEANDGVEPLPWVDEDNENSPEDRAVDDWMAGQALAGRLLHRVVALLAVMHAALRHRFHTKISAAERRRQVMLKKVRRNAQQAISYAEVGYYIPPAFALLTERPADTPPRRGRGKQQRKETPGVVSRPFDGNTIRELFGRADDDLVLVGDAGVGKSTQLAKLAEALAAEALDELGQRERADDDGGPPIPVILSLSTYQGQPLEDWLVEQIRRAYDGVAEELSRAWLAQGLILPLLDGLDQVPAQHRRECVAQIRKFRSRCDGMVVTCRDRDLALALRIGGMRAALKPPRRRDVQEFLAKDPATGIDAYADVRAALEMDKSLWELLCSPLMLSVIHHTYAGRPAPELRQPPGTSPEKRRCAIFDAYLERMLETSSRYSDQHTIEWLTWLARTLTQRDEEVLYLDRLDDSWIPAEQRKLPRVLSRYVVQLLACGLAFAWLALGVESGFLSVDLRGPAALMAGLLVMSVFQAPSSSPIPTGLVVTVSAASGALVGAWAAGAWSPGSSGVRSFLLFPVMGIIWGIVLDADSRSPASSPFSTAVVASVSAVVGGLAGPWAFSANWSRSEPAVAVVFLAYIWAMVTTYVGLLHTAHRPIEQLRWSWVPSTILASASPGQAMRTGAGLGAANGLVQAGLFGSALYLVLPGAGWLPTAAVVLIVSASLLGARFEPDLLEKRARPNEGIRLSARFAMILGVLNALAVALLLSALITLGDPDTSAPQVLFVSALAAATLGMSMSFRFGGATCVYYWALRLILAWRDDTPQRYQRFLHDAELRSLLRRVGSGFSFPHGLLQAHLNTAPGALLARLGPDASASSLDTLRI